MKEQQQAFGFGEEERILLETAQRFFKENCKVDELHAMVASEANLDPNYNAPWDEGVWQAMLGLGWNMILVPEEQGGMGLSLLAAILVLEISGKHACPSPLLSTCCSTEILKMCDSDAAKQHLEKIAEGATASLAITHENGSWIAEQTDVQCTLVDGTGKLSGKIYSVQDAQKVDFFIVPATQNGETHLYAVDAKASGLTITPDDIIDLTRDQAHLEFNEVSATLLSEKINAEQVIKQAMPSLLALISADLCGGSEWLLQTTVEYAKTREQFSRPIGFFQAVKHPLVDVMMTIDEAKSLTYRAAQEIALGDGTQAAIYAHMAKSRASDAAFLSSKKAVQFHGGIGFTWECFVQLFFKRQLHLQMLFGDAYFHRQALAKLLMD